MRARQAKTLRRIAKAKAIEVGVEVTNRYASEKYGRWVVLNGCARELYRSLKKRFKGLPHDDKARAMGHAADLAEVPYPYTVFRPYSEGGNT